MFPEASRGFVQLRHHVAADPYDALAVLTTAGLITARRGHLSPGAVSLDDYATRRRLHELRADRIERHRLERALWRDWLDVRFAAPPPEEPAVDSRGVDLDTLPHNPDLADEASWAHLLAAADQLPDEPPAHTVTEAMIRDDTWHTDDTEALWKRLAADPTPPPSDHAAAVELLTLELGATIVTGRLG